MMSSQTFAGGSAAAGGASAGQPCTDNEEPKVSVRQLRRACQRFIARHEMLCRDIASAERACGGPNDHTRRANDCLSIALRAMQTCLREFGRRVRPE